MSDFVPGQLIRCVQASSQSKRLLKGHVYMVIELKFGHVRLEDSEGGINDWNPPRFIPFEWQEGDGFKLVHAGNGLSQDRIGMTGKVVSKRTTAPGKPQRWNTDVSPIGCPHLKYFVGEEQIEFVQPGSETISVPASVKKPIRYLNRSTT